MVLCVFSLKSLTSNNTEMYACVKGQISNLISFSSLSKYQWTVCRPLPDHPSHCPGRSLQTVSRANPTAWSQRTWMPRSPSWWGRVTLSRMWSGRWWLLSTKLMWPGIFYRGSQDWISSAHDSSTAAKQRSCASEWTDYKGLLQYDQYILYETCLLLQNIYENA